jgi:hypothetical protein
VECGIIEGDLVMFNPEILRRVERVARKRFGILMKPQEMGVHGQSLFAALRHQLAERCRKVPASEGEIVLWCHLFGDECFEESADEQAFSLRLSKAPTRHATQAPSPPQDVP